MRSLSLRIAAGYALVVCISIATSVVAVYTFRSLSATVGLLSTEHFQNVIAAENLVKVVQRQENALISMFVDDVDVARMTVRENRDQFLSWYATAMEHEKQPQEIVYLDSVIASYRRFLDVSDSLQDFLRRRAPLILTKNYQFNVVRPVAERLKERCFDLLGANQAAIVAAGRSARDKAENGALAVVSAAVANILLSVVASVYAARRIGRPLRDMTDTVRAIGRGRLNQKIDITTDDEIGALIGEFNKMTERLHAYEEMDVHNLLAEKRKSAAIIASISDPVVVTDREHRILLMNDAARALAPEVFVDGAEGRSVAEAVRDDTWRGLLAADAAGREAIAARRQLFAALRGDRTTYYRPRQTAVADEGGVDIGVVTLLQDVTQFRELDRRKSEFLATVSHELRTPLTSLHMGVDLLLRGTADVADGRLRDLLGTAKDDVDRLTRLVQELLDLAKLESGAFPLRRADVEPERLVDLALQPLRLPLAESGVTLDVEVPPGLPTVPGDAHKLAWALTNIVENALRYTPAGGRIRITAGRDDGGVRFAVSDTGRGIAEEDRERVFEKFVQLDPVGGTHPGSLGLGLAIAHEVVRAHGGTIDFTSAAGAGSTFWFVLPAGPAADV